MQLKTVKSASDLPFKGIELVKIDNMVSEVIIAGKLRIKPGQYGGIQVLVETLGETVTRTRLTAALDGFPDAVKHFEHSWQADEAERAFKDKGATVTRETVSVLIDELGEVQATPADTSRELDEIPF
jgi:hypothetical protein